MKITEKKYEKEEKKIKTNKLSLIEASLTSYIVKPLKYYINSIYREKVVPKKGSIVYTDFGVSGIYMGEGKIVNIIVDNLLGDTGEVKIVSIEEFIRNSDFPDSIYVSSNDKGAVGNAEIIEKAKKYVGKKNKLGLVFEDSHSFVKKCLDYSKENHFGKFEDLTENMKSPLGLLKQKAQNKIGATKWLLWNVETDKINEYNESKRETPLDMAPLENSSLNKISKGERDEFRRLNIGKTIRKYEEVPLNDEIMVHLKKEYREAIDFFREINSEKIPDPIIKIIIKIIRFLEEIIEGYDQNENSIKGLGGDFSFRQLKEMGDEFRYMVQEMNRNRHIQEVLRKLGKGLISFEKNEKNKIAKINRDEVFGVDKSSNLSRVLPSELLNLEDENLKYLFYAKYLENSLLTYEIKAKEETEKNETEEKIGNKGPIVVCLDTSGSMKGTPLLKAKALVLAVIGILKEEKRELHIILFGAKGQIQEISLNGEENDVVKAVKFLKKSYEGGTDFETPLRRGIEIIDISKVYNNADILMVTDGACRITYQFRKLLMEEKKRLDFKIYTIICDTDRVEKDFSDGVIVI